MRRTENKWFAIGQLGATINVLICAGFILFSGCAGANYGGMQRSREVTQAFETYHLFPDHRYYYLNQENNPYAVVALNDGYSINERQWREFDPQSGKLEKIVELIKRFPVTYSYGYGSHMRDAQGNQIGYCYTSLRWIGIRVNPVTKNVLISTDTPWLRDDDVEFGTRTGVGVRFGR